MVKVLYFLAMAAFFTSCKDKDGALKKGDVAHQRTLSEKPLTGRADRQKGITGLKPNQVAITWDDGPGPQTEALAKRLGAQGIPSTFFVLGRQVSRFPKALAAMKSAGHLVANHTTRHLTSFAALAAPQQAQEVAQTHELIKGFVNPPHHLLLRSPGGSWSPQAAQSLKDLGFDNYTGHVGWDVGGTLTPRYGADWACWTQNFAHPETQNGPLTPQDCGQRYLNEWEDNRAQGRGSIFLLHDIHELSHAMFFEVLLPKLRQEGVEFVRADQIPLVKAHIDTTLRPTQEAVVRRGILDMVNEPFTASGLVGYDPQTPFAKGNTPGYFRSPYPAPSP